MKFLRSFPNMMCAVPARKLRPSKTATENGMPEAIKDLVTSYLAGHGSYAEILDSLSEIVGLAEARDIMRRVTEAAYDLRLQSVHG